MHAKLTSPMLAILLAGCASTTTLPRPRDPEHPPPAPLAVELLKHLPGVRVDETRSGIRLFVRGSLREPLVVLDGVSLLLGASGALDGINPRDITRIRLLTDPVELAFYGPRGADGVILITTRRR